MLTFTSSEPGFMGLAGSDPFVPIKNPEVKEKWVGVYLHGDAEAFCGFDIPILVDGVLEYKPEQEVLVAGPKESIPCLLIAWKAEDYSTPPVKICKGLICSKEDTIALEYARKCQKERTKHL